MPERKKSLRTEPPAARMVEDIVGCKWSLAVLERVRSGVSRPGALEHSLPGLSTKVLNERLRKLQRYGIVSRTAYPEVPPRVEYALTPRTQVRAGSGRRGGARARTRARARSRRPLVRWSR
jgi:DNA-binding HxlR family transcriptional regulator